MLATVDPLLPKIQDVTAPGLHWGMSTKSLVALTVLALSTVGPLVYLFVRDWLLDRNFRRFWKKQAVQGTAEPVPMTAVAPRQTFIALGKQQAARKPAAEENNAAGSNPRIAEPGAAAVKPVLITQTATSLGRGAVAPGVASLAEPSVGTVKVDADDEFCEIYVDARFVGNAPAALVLKEGAHTIVVKKAGCKEYRRELYMNSGAQLTLRAVLEQSFENGHAPSVSREVSHL